MIDMSSNDSEEVAKLRNVYFGHKIKTLSRSKEEH
jgi:hypothetical protein